MAKQALPSGDAKGVVTQLAALFAPWNRMDAPGLTVGVAMNGRLLYRRGFGMASLETAVANTPTTRMRIGSTTKHFAGLLALLLAEEGKLDLDAPIRTYIPELSGAGGDPSVRLLLQHRGGARCHIDYSFMCRGIVAPPVGTGLADLVRQTGRNFEPGEAMIYSNGGYHLVSIALERAGGAPFADQLKQRLFDPIGMVDTVLLQSDHAVTPGVATLHSPAPDGGWRRGLFPSEELLGEGGIVSTVDDMLRWTAHLATRDRFGSPESWTALTELPRTGPRAGQIYGLGVMTQAYRGVRTVWHNGGVAGGSCQMLTTPDHGVDVVILANGGPGANPARLAEQVLDIVLADHLGERAVLAATAEHADLLGDWWSPETNMLYGLQDEGGVLRLSVCGTPIGPSPEAGPDGEVINPAGGLGEIRIQRAADGEGLSIRFGERAADYRKLDKVSADADAFADAVVGRYHSDDAGCTATITRDGAQLSIRIADGLGSADGRLDCLDGRVGLLQSPLMLAALSFTARDGRANGFELNSSRTRNLVFQRS